MSESPEEDYEKIANDNNDDNININDNNNNDINIDEENMFEVDEEEDKKQKEEQMDMELEEGNTSKMNIVFRYFQPTDLAKSAFGLLKYLLSKKLSEKGISYKYPQDANQFLFYIVTSTELPAEPSEIYKSVKKSNVIMDDGKAQNMIFVIVEEVENEEACDKFNSPINEYDVFKLYIQKERNDKNHIMMINCINNDIQIEKLISKMESFYNKFKNGMSGDTDEQEEKEEETIEEVEKKNLENFPIEGEEENNLEEIKEYSINKNVYSNSVLLKVDDSSKLFLKNPAQTIKLVLNKFKGMMNGFPKNTKTICSKIFDVLQQKDESFYIETDRAVMCDISIYKFGKEENLGQFSSKVSNRLFEKNVDKVDKLIDNNQKYLKNPLRRYLILRDYMKQNKEENRLFDYDIHLNEYYPSYVLEEILLTKIAEKGEKFRMLIPFFTHVHIFNDKELNNNVSNANMEQSSIYLISYLLYDNRRIYFLPLYLIDRDNNEEPSVLNEYTISNKRMRKGLVDNISNYLQTIIRESVLNSFAKIQYGGLITPFIDEIENDDIPLNVMYFLIVFFQLFYSILNPEENPNEVLQIFSTNDLNDHFYIFLTFLQEVC